MFSGLLKHTPPSAPAASASSSASDQNSSNAQTALPTIPRGHLVVGPKDQLRLLTPVGSSATSNHCATVKHSLSEEDDGGGGGRVKKKRKKKDKRDKAEVLDGDERGSSKPKKRKEEKDATTVTGRRGKEVKEGKERKERKTKTKETRKDNGTQLRHVACAGNAVGPGTAVVPVKIPGKRGRKPKIKVLPPLPPNQGNDCFNFYGLNFSIN